MTEITSETHLPLPALEGYYLIKNIAKLILAMVFMYIVTYSGKQIS